LSVLLAILLEGELTLLVTVGFFERLIFEGGLVGFLSGSWDRGREKGGGVGKSHSFSFFPLRLFLPPFPLFLGILAVCRYYSLVG